MIFVNNVSLSRCRKRSLSEVFKMWGTSASTKMYWDRDEHLPDLVFRQGSMHTWSGWSYVWYNADCQKNKSFCGSLVWNWGGVLFSLKVL